MAEAQPGRTETCTETVSVLVDNTKRQLKMTVVGLTADGSTCVRVVHALASSH